MEGTNSFLSVCFEDGNDNIWSLSDIFSRSQYSFVNWKSYFSWNRNVQNVQ